MVVSLLLPPHKGEGKLRRRWRAWLLQRMGAREGVYLRQLIGDPREGRERRGVDIEEFRARRLARDADIGELDLVTVAITPGLRALQMRFERGQRRPVPMLAPFGPRRLVELELVFEI